MVPVVYIVDKKTAFQLAVDRETIGADIYRFVGRDEEQLLGTSGDIHVLLVVWVTQLPGTNTFTYYFGLDCVGAEGAASTFRSAK